MVADRDHVAAVVPAFAADGRSSWTGAQTPVTLDAYHLWRFRTGAPLDFEDLALALHSRPPGGVPGLGYARLDHRAGDGIHQLRVRGPLAPPLRAGESADAPLSGPVAASMAALRQPRMVHGRAALQMPHYGDAWVADPEGNPGGWGATINRDPRHRAAAGLGMWCGIDQQDLIAGAAADRAGALPVADQQIRALTAGIGAAESLWVRRLPETAAARTALFGPALGRVLAADPDTGAATGTVLGAITGPAGGDRPLPPALFSSAARRVLRPGTARSRRAAPGATAPSAVLDAANDCTRMRIPDPPAGCPALGTFGQDPFAEPPSSDAVRERLVDAIRYQGWYGDEWYAERVPLDRAADFLRDVASGDRSRLEAWAEEPGGGELPPVDGPIDGVVGSRPTSPCHPVGVDLLDPVLVDGFRPISGPGPKRVVDTIGGLDPAQPLAPPEICPDLDLPAWRFLRARSTYWLLPGADGIADGDVVALSTNQRFVDAFLVGLNTQVLGELRWRNIPVRAGCTPLRRFWDRLTPGGASRSTDIVGVHKWPPASPLGDPTHSAEPAERLVLAIRSPLFRQYPATLIYLTPAATRADGRPDWTRDAPLAQRTFPVFSGEIRSDLVFFGFPVAASELARLWVVVEEAPRGYRFHTRAKRPAAWSGTPHGGAAAADAFAGPTRVLLRGTDFLDAA